MSIFRIVTKWENQDGMKHLGHLKLVYKHVRINQSHGRIYLSIHQCQSTPLRYSVSLLFYEMEIIMTCNTHVTVYIGVGGIIIIVKPRYICMSIRT